MVHLGGSPRNAAAPTFIRGRPLELQIILRFVIVFAIIIGTTILGIQERIDTAAVTAIYGAALGYATGSIETLQTTRAESMRDNEVKAQGRHDAA
jgi:hypothetical protein